MLSSYSLTGMLDDGNFSDWVKVILMKLNLPAFNQKEVVLDVIDYKIDLPEDFHLLWAVWICDKGETKRVNKDAYQGTISFTQEDTCYERTGECYTLEPVAHKVIKRNYYMSNEVETTTYKNTRLLKLINKHVKCSDSCVNYRVDSDEQYFISDNSLQFNFEKGSVILQYFAFEVDENGLPMIPDDVRIEETLEAFITYRLFQKGYYNNIADLRDRMLFSKQDYETKYVEAERHLNIPEYKTMVEYGKKRLNRWKPLLPEDKVSLNNSWWIKPTLTAQQNFVSDLTRTWQNH